MKYSNDYRIFGDDTTFERIKEEKALFLNRFQMGKNGIVYRKINKRHTDEYTHFRDIYSDRCSYCGMIMEYAFEEAPEIDHFNPNLKGDLERCLSTDEQLENLVFACKSCNNGKQFLSKTTVPPEYFDLLHPDYNISKIFFRDSDYRIEIRDKYKDDEIIKQLYQKLHFDNDIMRIFYIITIFHYYKAKSKDKARKDLFSNIIFDLREKIYKYKCDMHKA